MRYARPPVGDLRWRRPVKPEEEEDVQRAKEVGSAHKQCPKPICFLSVGSEELGQPSSHAGRRQADNV